MLCYRRVPGEGRTARETQGWRKDTAPRLARVEGGTPRVGNDTTPGVGRALRASLRVEGHHV